MKTMKKLVSTFLDICVMGIVFLILTILIGIACGITPYVVMSGSMEPEIMTGSICFVNENVKYDDIEEGDIIAFDVGSGIMATHRVINVTENGFETKGDNNDQSDGISTTRANYCGETIFSIPYVGYMIVAMQTKRGVIICGTGIISLFLIYLMLSVESILDEKHRIDNDGEKECS